MQAANTVERDSSLCVQIAITSVVMTDLHDASNHLFCQAKHVHVCCCFQGSPVTIRNMTVK